MDIVLHNPEWTPRLSEIIRVTTVTRVESTPFKVARGMHLVQEDHSSRVMSIKGDVQIICSIQSWLKIRIETCDSCCTFSLVLVHAHVVLFWLLCFNEIVLFLLRTMLPSHCLTCDTLMYCDARTRITEWLTWDRRLPAGRDATTAMERVKGQQGRLQELAPTVTKSPRHRHPKV